MRCASQTLNITRSRHHHYHSLSARYQIVKRILFLPYTHSLTHSHSFTCTHNQVACIIVIIIISFDGCRRSTTAHLTLNTHSILWYIRLDFDFRMCCAWWFIDKIAAQQKQNDELKSRRLFSSRFSFSVGLIRYGSVWFTAFKLKCQRTQNYLLYVYRKTCITYRKYLQYIFKCLRVYIFLSLFIRLAAVNTESERKRMFIMFGGKTVLLIFFIY